MIMVLSLAGWGCKKSEPAPVTTTTPQNNAVTVPVTVPVTTSPTTTKAAPKVIKKTTSPTTNISSPAAELSYNEAVAKYGGSGYRMQFIGCSAVPGSMTVKKGVKFMLDNRNDKPHTIGVGTASYKLAAYGWVAVSISAEGKINITCDGGGSGFINVQP